eukprot:Hpha_TRINITY_DN6018_c0_g1::TRINITY_DN6018_c0_g1_i1::g.63357::m.63357
MTLPDVPKLFLSNGVPDHWGRLGVPRNADRKTVKWRWKALSFALHPDKCDAKEREEAARRFHLVNDAWQVLGNPDELRRYLRRCDISASAPHRPSRRRPAPPAEDFEEAERERQRQRAREEEEERARREKEFPLPQRNPATGRFVDEAGARGRGVGGYVRLCRGRRAGALLRVCAQMGGA